MKNKQNQLKTIETIEGKSGDNEKHLKYKDVFNELSNKRIGEVYNISKEINFNNLTYHFKGSNTAPINFVDFRGPMHIYNEIKNGNISIEKTEEDQKQFKSQLNEITTVNPKHRSKDQLKAIKNVKNLYNSRDKVIKLYKGYAKIISKAMYKTKQGTGLKILAPKQMLQRLPIALAQVKSGNKSVNLLNEIPQIVCSLYQSKKITKVINYNIIESIQL